MTRTVIGAGAISAPFTDLTRQYVPVERVEYSDGLVAITYHRRIEGLDRWRVLVWDSTLGYRHGFLWSEQIRGQAIRRYREGKRADHTQCRLMLRGS